MSEAVNETLLMDEIEQRLADLLSVDLPISRVKKICKLDPEVSMLNHDAILMITKATELFVKEMAKACYTQAVIDKRKTIQTKDIDRVIKTNWMYDFLEDALDGWPDANPRPKKGTSNGNEEEELPDTVDVTDTDDTVLLDTVAVTENNVADANEEQDIMEQ